MRHALGLAIVLPIVAIGFGMSIWLYILVPVWLGQSFIAIRTFAEHQWSERPDGRTIIVERSPLSLLFLNNNLHLVHHKQPQVAWYRLPQLFRERRAEWIAMNGGYVYPNYLALLKDFAFRAKEPVVHPFLRRAPDLGRAFRPRVRARSVQGLGTAPVPAQPPTE
jgi:fatty acid desaturase